MKLTNFIVALAVVIAATLNFGAQGFPGPQVNIWDGPTNFISGDDIVFEGLTNGPPSSRVDVDLCCWYCQGPSKYNPVCGSNGLTYNNPEQLTCSRNCGKDVSQLHMGRCPAPSDAVTPSSTTPRAVTIQPQVALCARDCMVTSQYNPVCGSDGVMYNNAELLICARNCGINVTQRHTGACTVKPSRV